MVPTAVRLNADTNYTGKGVTMAFLDSGFYPHPDLVEPENRILAYHDVTDETSSLKPEGYGSVARLLTTAGGIDRSRVESWQWHGTQTSVVAAGNGRLSDGLYRGLASAAQVVLIKASERGRISEENIARGIEWVIDNRDRHYIRVLNISLGGDQDVPCSRSIIGQAAEEAISQGVVVVAAAGNAGAAGKRSIPPANSPSVVTVGGYDDKNDLDPATIDLYDSNFGPTADGTVKPELIAPAMWVAAPILPQTDLFERAQCLSRLWSAPDYELPKLASELAGTAEIPADMLRAGAAALRDFVETALNEDKIIAAHYQHVDGTSFAAPIVASVVAQMIEANPDLTPAMVKKILVSTADRIAHAPVVRQGYGVVDARQAVLLAGDKNLKWNNIGGGPPRVESGKVLFVFSDDKASNVLLAGEFNGWDGSINPLEKDEHGFWRVALSAPSAGIYQYKFVVDGQRWVEDPNNQMKVPDNRGGMNSVLTIK